jgi:hypothetical protein
MRGGSRFAVIAGACCGAAGPLLLAGCHPIAQLGTGTHNPPAQVYTVAGRVTTLVVKGGSGSIDVTGSSRGTISVSQHASYGKTPPTATHVISGTTLTLSYSCPSEFVCGVSYDVQVPRGVAVQVSTAAGPVTLTSLAGPVSAQTSAGLITAISLTSPTATLKSNAGGIDATFSAPPSSVHATTNVGPITLAVPGSAAYRIDTHAYIGSSTVTVPRSASSRHVISANSDLGSITISPS